MTTTNYPQMRNDKEQEWTGLKKACKRCSKQGIVGEDLHVALNVTFGFGIEGNPYFYIRCADLNACQLRHPSN